MRVLLALCALLAAQMLPAATFRIDDSASFPHEPITPMRWRSIAPGSEQSHTVEGTTLVTVRLNVAPWFERSGKIYMVLQDQPVGQITVDFSTQGKLLPGRLVSGERVLVFSGVVRTPNLEDTIALRIETDGRRLSTPQRLQFYFEIDVE